jgi:hypothetical protein
MPTVFYGKMTVSCKDLVENRLWLVGFTLISRTMRPCVREFVLFLAAKNDNAFQNKNPHKFNGLCHNTGLFEFNALAVWWFVRTKTIPSGLRFNRTVTKGLAQ